MKRFLISAHIIRVISSPSSSTMGFLTLIFLAVAMLRKEGVDFVMIVGKEFRGELRTLTGNA